MIVPVSPSAYITTIPPSHSILAAASSPANTEKIPHVPFFSQFKDITSPSWKKRGCGIASLGMIIEYYKPNSVSSIDTLLTQGITAKAYQESSGWTYNGLISVSKKYGLDGISYDFGKQNQDTALNNLKSSLKNGPVIASIHYKFDPKSTIPHLVVITAIKNDSVYYNDPAAKTGQLEINLTQFLKAWKKRYIVIRPTSEKLALLSH